MRFTLAVLLTLAGVAGCAASDAGPEKTGAVSADAPGDAVVWRLRVAGAT
ncbi:MAG: hypothetical protein ACYTGX_04155 [Planctomycetota bacterium]|jgi:hypothetical protein